MFSPDGRLYQVEYASKIVEQGTLGTALIFDNGILFAADKKVSSKLILPDSIEKLFKIDDHIGAVSSGLVGDARRLVQFARQEAQDNIMYYDEAVQVETLVKKLSAVKQYFTQYGGVRPFGVSFIIGGVDDSGLRLFETEPSGALAEYKAIAIGKGKKEAMELLEKEYSYGLGYEAGIVLLAKVLKKGLSEKERLEVGRLDFAVIDGTERQFKKIPKEEIRSVLGKNKID
jgi:proteasome alpha subunit